MARVIDCDDQYTAGLKWSDEKNDYTKEFSCRRETALQGGSVLGGWWVIAWVRQYSAPNVVGARKLKALIFYTISPLLYEQEALQRGQRVGRA